MQLVLNHSEQPAPPFDLMWRCNNFTSATIIWNSTGTNVTYTVYTVPRTSHMSSFPGILQESYVLNDLEVDKDYVVSVTATNECGDESEHSENITIRINETGNMYVLYMHVYYVYSVLCTVQCINAKWL